MSITKDEARKVARLAGLDPDDAELTTLASQLSAVVGHFAALSRVDVSGVEPTGLILEVETPFRKDVPGDPLNLSVVLRAAPAHDGSFLVVLRPPRDPDPDR